jgi:hypothetical protein
MTTEPKMEPDITLSLGDVEKVLRDPELRDLIDSCALDQPGSIGVCVQDLLLDRLVTMFTPDEELEAQPGDVTDAMPLVDWLENDPNPDDLENCRPCALPVTLRWYSDYLRENGLPQLAIGLERKGLQDQPLTWVKEMDRIKSIVDPDVRERLLDFDKSTQANVA